MEGYNGRRKTRNVLSLPRRSKSFAQTWPCYNFELLIGTM